MRKLISLLVVAVLVLTGCGSSSEDAGLDGSTITVATNALNEDNPAGDEAIEAADSRREEKAQMLEDFQSETGVTLEFAELPQEDQLETITQSVLAGDPVADVVRVSSDVYQQLVASDMLEDITEYSTEYADGGQMPISWPVDAGQVFDKYYGVSRDLSSYPEMLVYDMTLLDKAGMEETPLDMYKSGDWNWDNARQYFLDVQSGLGDDTTIWAAEPYFVAKYGIASNGIVPITSDGQINLTDDKVYEALDFYKGLYDDGIMEFYLDEDGAPIWASAEGAWESGDAVFTTLEGWRSDCCIKNTDKEYGFVPYPTNKGVKTEDVQVSAGTGDMYVVPKGVENPAGAAQVAFYLNRQANAEYYVEGLDVAGISDEWMATNSSEEENGSAYTDLKNNAVPDLSGFYSANTDFDMTEAVVNYFVSGESIASSFESGTKVLEQNVDSIKQEMESSSEATSEE